MKENVLKKKSFDFALRIVKLDKSEYLTFQQFESINTDAVEIIKLITSSINTAKKQLIASH